MKVKELIEELERLPQDAEVVGSNEYGNSEIAYEIFSAQYDNYFGAVFLDFGDEFDAEDLRN